MSVRKSNHEFADQYQYQAHSCLGLLENEPQINADERRLIKSGEEACFLNSNLIIGSHIIEMTYSLHNHCP